MLRCAKLPVALLLTGVMVFGFSGSGRDTRCVSGARTRTVMDTISQGLGSILSPPAAMAAEGKKKTVTAKTAKKAEAGRKLAKTEKTEKNRKTAKAAKAEQRGRETVAVGKAKKASKKVGQVAHAKTGHPRLSAGRCEPQSLTYARQRSGIMRSRSGRENGPLTWFASETRLGKTSNQPLPGSVLILGSDSRHGMSTGHVAYVERVRPDGPSRYKITFSHTNYDRRCSLETDIEALYNSSAQTLDIFSGAWQGWGRGLRVAGFIQE